MGKGLGKKIHWRRLLGVIAEIGLLVLGNACSHEPRPAVQTVNAATAQATVSTGSIGKTDPTTFAHDEATVSNAASDGDVWHSASSGLLFDATRRTVVSSKAPDKRVYPASLSKLVTACVALQYVEKDTVLPVGAEQKLVHAGSSLCSIHQGQRLTLYDLMCGMLMASGNDAAYTIAVNVARNVYPTRKLNDRQAVDQFCELMNRFAKDIGMPNSHFTNPDGWDDPKQYTTANDLLTLALYAQKITDIQTITGYRRHAVVFASGEKATWHNTNLLLDPSSRYYDPHVTGMKTGTTDKAGNCLIASATKDGEKRIAIILGCQTNEDRYTVAANLWKRSYS